MSMSTSIRGQLHKSSFHGRHDSGELDVFEAARYFSAANDQSPGGRYMNKQHQRRSLDMPMMRSQFPPEYHHIMIMDHHHQQHHQNQNQNQAIIEKKNKKYKQPSSPGGRLASFLNSLFNQTHSKKKKKPKSARDFVEDESTPGRRKRRSSISHFLSSSDKKSPPYANTPIKSCKISNDQKNYKITLLDELHAERNGRDYAWIEERLRMRNINGVSADKEKLREDEDEGADSDSSSDLFDLPIANHDLDFLSSGLPLYGTTHMDRINANS